MPVEKMFADTNLFLRYLTNDVPEQASAVEKILQLAEAGEIELVTNSMVIAEIVWTLESYYRLPKVQIKEKLLAILNTPGLYVADTDLLLQAVQWYEDHNIDFIDAFNAKWMIENGIASAFTFDKRHFGRLKGINFQIPG